MEAAPQVTPLGAVLVYLITTSLIAHVLMFWDKFRAGRDGQRVPERSLLFWAFIGGAFGAKLAQRLYRHKTTKLPFRRYLNLSVVFVVLLLVLLLALWVA